MNDPAQTGSANAPRTQLLIGGGLFLFLALVSVGLSLLTRNDALDAFIVREQQQQDRARKQRYSYEHYFVDFEDRLINEELPAADYSRGGVYLMGTSNLKWATRLWELPEKQRALIHNYGIGATSHQFQSHFLKFLLDHEGMLSAGGAKNMVIYGVSWHAVGPNYSPQEFFPSLWERHGYYKYDPQAGILPQPAAAWTRALRFERVRISGLLRTMASIGARRMGYHNEVRTLNLEAYVNERLAWYSPAWEARLREQVSIFEQMVADLRARGVTVAIVMLPQGSWEDRLPQKHSYDAAIKSICERRGIPLYDWSKLLDDDDFADSNHANPSGVDKMNPKFVELALPFLRSTGALAPTD